MRFPCIFFLAILIFSGSVEAQKISEWRPENRTGVSSETGLLKSWPATGPTLLWTNPDLPKGNSSVSFGNNTIYITGTKDGNDILFALDMQGKTVWQTVMGRAWNASYPESRATPTVQGNEVYTCSGFGDLACIDGTTGKIIWTYKASEEYKGTYGNWGIAEALLLDGDKLYYTPGGPETMTIALKKKTGDLIWKSASLNTKPGYVSPILITYAGIKMLVNVTLDRVFAVDVSNGEILWKVPIEKPGGSGRDLILCVTPLYDQGKIYVTGGYNVGGMMLKLAEDGKGASVVWTDKTLDVHHGGVVLVNGYIYGSSWLNNADGNWCCIDWNTGEKKWEEHWNCKGSIISAEGLLYIYDEKKGNVGLLKATPEKFDLISTFQITQGNPGPFWAHPVIHDGVLYLRHNSALMAYDIKAK
ncbi:MAG: PQQ-binding-like beta-propeller repeat protein [Prolixibacteraceae bacterium]